MSEVEIRFKKAVHYIRNAPAQESSNEQKLKVYGLYKQAAIGDNTTAQPWSVQFEASAKWNAWTANKGMSKEDAMKAYAKILDDGDANWEKSDVLKNFDPASVSLQ